MFPTAHRSTEASREKDGEMKNVAHLLLFQFNIYKEVF